MIVTMLAEAWSALVANRLRSVLTMLGMIIGVAAVILMLAIGGGVQKQVSESIAGLGSNLLIVTAGSGRSGPLSGGAGSGATLRIDDADRIAEIDNVVAAAPSTNVPAQVVAGPINWATQVTGSVPAYFLVNEWTVGDGRTFTEREERAGARVAVLGQTVADKLFGASDPLGQTIRAKGVSLRVIGIMEKRGQGFGGQDRDDVIIVPLTTALRLLQGNAFRRSIRSISVSVASWHGIGLPSLISSCPHDGQILRPLNAAEHFGHVICFGSLPSFCRRSFRSFTDSVPSSDHGTNSSANPFSATLPAWSMISASTPICRRRAPSTSPP